MTASPADLDQSLQWCRDVTAARARSFYLGLRLAPEPQRSALFALYAWNRIGDDIVDDLDASDAERKARLDGFADASRAAFRGEPTEDSPVWPAIAHTAETYCIPIEWFGEMLDGLRSDIDHRQPESLDELDLYCRRVAGSVGRCCVAIWGVRRDEDRQTAFECADTLGRAFQLTNILRDIGEDAAGSPSRCYIPREILDAEGLELSSLLDWSQPGKARGVVMRLAAEARASYCAGDRLADLVRPRFRPTLWAMRRMYERTLAMIEAQPSRAVRASHIRPGKVTALAIACRAFAMSALASGDDSCRDA